MDMVPWGGEAEQVGRYGQKQGVPAKKKGLLERNWDKKKKKKAGHLFSLPSCPSR